MQLQKASIFLFSFGEKFKKIFHNSTDCEYVYAVSTSVTRGQKPITSLFYLKTPEISWGIADQFLWENKK